MSEKKSEKLPVTTAMVTPYEKARLVAETKLPKLYNAMTPSDITYTGPEIAKAIGLDPDSDVDVQAVSLTWHKFFDEGKFAVPQMQKPEKVEKKGKPVLPVI